MQGRHDQLAAVPGNLRDQRPQMLLIELRRRIIQQQRRAHRGMGGEQFDLGNQQRGGQQLLLPAGDVILGGKALHVDHEFRPVGTYLR